LTWETEGYVKNVLQTGISHFMVAPFASLAGAHLPGTSVYKKTLEMNISLHSGPVGQHGVSVYREIIGIVRIIGMLWKWSISLSMGALLRKPGLGTL
jgi:hypothetical protein